jgi:putative DNA primase/helicase
MVIIPQQLRLQKFIKTINKIPCEQAWTTTNNYNIDDVNFNQHLSHYKTYGVLTGYNNLLVIDCDNLQIQNSLLTIPIFQQTFTVKTATKGFYHFYFYTDEPPKSFKLLDSAQSTLLDAQGIGKQVVGPNSVLNTGRVYEIVNQDEIKIVTYAEIKQIIEQYGINNKILTDENKQQDNSEFVEKDPLLRLIKEQIKISDILNEQEISTKKNPTDCPFHDSVGGKCFSYTDNLFHCFHCLEQGNIFKLYQKIHHCDFTEAKKALAAKAKIEIPENNIYEQIIILLQLKKMSEATEIIVRDFLKTHSVFTTKNDIATEVWIYEDGIYKPNGRTTIIAYLRKLLGEDIKQIIINLVTLKIESDTYINQEDFFINEDINLIPVANGILNWRTKDLLEFSPKYKFFNKMPSEYNIKSDCPKIKKFFKDILVDENDIKVIQELFGYVLYRDYRYEKSFLFLGTGRNGKSKTLELMKTFVGVENCVNISLQQLEKDNFIMSSLFGKLANLSADISKTALHETGNFKLLVGHDVVSAPRKFQTPIQFVNYAKMIFLANELPVTHDNSIGFFDRWIMIDFNFRFYLPNQFQALLTRTEFDKIADTELIKKLTTPEEMSGLLNWAIEGLHRLLHQNNFSFSTSTDGVKRKWKLRSSTFSAFFDECCEKQYGKIITKDDLRQAYYTYCNKYQVSTESDRAIHFKLSDLGIVDKVTTINGEISRFWLDINFKQHMIKPENKPDEPKDRELSPDDIINFRWK